MYSDPQRNRNGILLYASSVGLVIFLSLSLVRGWRVSDFFYVTQHTFRSGVASLSNALSGLQSRLQEVKSRLQARISEVSRKQDELTALQVAMRAQLTCVGDDVEAVRSQVGQVYHAVLDLDTTLTELGGHQRQALRGIYILCKAVAELAANSNIEAKDELIEFTRSPLWRSCLQPVGLESVLRDVEIEPENNAGWPYSRRRLTGNFNPSLSFSTDTSDANPHVHNANQLTKGMDGNGFAEKTESAQSCCLHRHGHTDMTSCSPGCSGIDEGSGELNPKFKDGELPLGRIYSSGIGSNNVKETKCAEPGGGYRGLLPLRLKSTSR